MSPLTQQPPLLAPLTQEDLGTLQIHLPVLKIFSFRGPQSTGGVVNSLSPLAKQLGTKIHWVALSGIPADNNNHNFNFYSPQIPNDLLTAGNKVISEYLWPLFHGLSNKARFNADNWKSFRQLSELLSSAMTLKNNSFPILTWIHDFEMCLIAPLLSSEAGVILAHFWHVPWPNASLLKDSPVIAEIVESLLPNRLIGFHTNEYANNFLRTVEAILPKAKINFETMTIEYRNHITSISVMPLGLDFQYWQRLAKLNRVEAEAIPVRHRLAQQIILGVDRLDYTKGVLEKLEGIDHFLTCHPDWSRRFHYVQIAQQAHHQSGLTSEYRNQVLKKVNEINSKYCIDGWEPIVWLEAQLSHAELSTWYQSADVLLVTPIRDGLNLIAKEYVACRADEQGALILSKQAGVAAELVSGALLIEPNSCEEISNAIEKALSFDVEEKRRRMLSMRHVIGWNRLHDWACGFLRLAIENTKV
jgi:trehalose-6-phosphate synthase